MTLARTFDVGNICHIWGNYKKDPEKRTTVGEKHGTVELSNFTRRESSALPKAVTAR